jgi:hypothetical protein
MWPDFDYDELGKKFEMEKKEQSNWANVDFGTWLAYRLPCNVTADMKQGDGMLYNSDTTHRGRAHTDPNAPERILIFIMFAASRQGPEDKRSLPLGEVHALDWRMWGHTIDDCATMKERPWRLWHAFGIGNTKGTVRPWNLLDDIFMIFKNENERAHSISEEVTAKYLWDLVNALVPLTCGVTILYVSTLLIFILIGMVLRSFSETRFYYGKVRMMNGNGAKKHKFN